jgi:hypothetical protein
MVGPPRPPFPSAPSEPSLRRLGTGSSSGGDRPIRAQVVVALVALIILLAVPLYLWRRPSTHPVGSDAGAPTASAVAIVLPSALPPIAIPAPFQPETVRTSALQRVRCGSSRTKASNNVSCDALPALERMFVEAVQKTVECAPRNTKEGTINFVLEVDFAHKTLHLFPGKSGEWHGPSARRATKCVEHAIGKPDLTAITHNFSYYAMAVMATYPPTGGTSGAAPVATAAVLVAPAYPSASVPIGTSTATTTLPTMPPVR